MNNETVVTAKHCLISENGLSRLVSVKVYLGGSTTAYTTAKGFAYDERIDVGCVTLRDAVNNVAFPPLALDVNDWLELPSGALLTVMGYGMPDTNLFATTTLARVGVSDCERVWQTAVDFPTDLCAGFPYAASRVCAGDSGGPLMYEGRVYGVLSRGKAGPCERVGVPAIYTSMAASVAFLGRFAGSAAADGNRSSDGAVAFPSPPPPALPDAGGGGGGGRSSSFRTAAIGLAVGGAVLLVVLALVALIAYDAYKKRRAAEREELWGVEEVEVGGAAAKRR